MHVIEANNPDGILNSLLEQYSNDPTVTQCHLLICEGIYQDQWEEAANNQSVCTQVKPHK